ncbi:unnamed protein product [Brassica rapa subsp. trilocularis]
MTWLVFHNRLSTVDKIRTCGIDQGCMLCGETNETRDHLFFACQYTYGRTLLGSCLKNPSSRIGMIQSQHSWTSTYSIIRSIDKMIRDCISSLHYARDHPLKGLLRRWFEISSV